MRTRKNGVRAEAWALLVAELREFGERGDHASTVLGVCASARVSARDFYAAFGSREDLFVAVYRQQVGAALTARAVHREVLGIGALLENERRHAIALFEAALDERLAAVGGVPAGTALGIVGVVNETISSELFSERPDLGARIDPLTRVVTRLLTG